MPAFMRRTYGRWTPRRSPAARRIRSPASFRNPSVARAYRSLVPRAFRGPQLTPKQGFPGRITVTLPYHKQIRINPGVVAYADYVFAVNQPVDIDQTGGGAVGQARGYDQWAAQYNDVRVNFVDVTAVIRQRAAHGIVAYAVGNGQTTALGSDFRQGEDLTSMYLGVSDSSNPIRRKFRVYPSQILGMTEHQYQADDRTSSTTGAATAQAAYLHFVMTQIDVTTVLDCEISIELDLNMTFFTRLNIAAS